MVVSKSHGMNKRFVVSNSNFYINDEDLVNMTYHDLFAHAAPTPRRSLNVSDRMNRNIALVLK